MNDEDFEVNNNNKMSNLNYRATLNVIWKWSLAFSKNKDSDEASKSFVDDFESIEGFLVACFSELELLRKENNYYKNHVKMLNNFMGVQ